MKKPYHQFETRDFVLDNAFRQWVLQPTEQNMTFWHTFMLKYPEQQANIDEAASILLHLRTNHDDLTDASQQRIHQVLLQAFDNQQRADTSLSASPIRPLWQQRRFISRIAASLTGLLLIAGGTMYYLLHPSPQRIHTTFGENRSVTLPDGSTVLLNGNSTLTFTDDWSGNKPREVWLDGEGFFKVAKKQHLSYQLPRGAVAGGLIKFITHTPGVDITVLGTQFNVNTRRGNTAVTLVEGRVQLSKPGVRQSRVVELKPGQFATIQPSVGKVEVKDEKPQLHTSWVQRQFLFENTPLSDIAQQLRDTYGLDLVFEDADLANRRFTGNLSDHSIETLLTTLSLTFNLSVRREGERIILQRNQQTLNTNN
ncbi:FecR family protein [Spirosoma soli]|uniref:FecR family protein n=1 Tax=Spirosoma soli TaxID=1770529 RepID=A0ABW5M179_9BACT